MTGSTFPESLFEDLPTMEVRENGRRVTILRPDSTEWLVVRSLGEQVVLALDELGYVRTGPLGEPVGFRIKELALTPDGHYAVLHVDVTSVRLFQPAGRSRGERGKPVAYLTLASPSVVEQVRVRISEMMSRPVDVWSDNHYFVRYVVDLTGLSRADTFQSGELVAHVDAAAPFAVPLGVDAQGELRWLDVVGAGRHLLLTGATGGGKSTWMDTAICTLVHNTDPQRLQMVFLDAQKLNFSPYQVLDEHHFTDREGRLGIAWRPDDIVAGLARLDREHLRRVDLIGSTPWGHIEDYNAHAGPDEQLPYVFVFTDELMVLRAQMNGAQARAFDRHLLSLIVGARKVGFRIVLCLQYVKGSFLPPEIAAQAALQLAFWNSPQGSKNSIGDTAATMLPGQGRFIVEGLPGGRQVLQGLYVNRETVLELLDFRGRRPTYDVDTLVLDVIGFALQELEGNLTRAPLVEAFGHLMSQRQIDNLLDGLERVGLALPVDRSQVPNLPRRLRVESIAEAVEVLQFHPEISFREEEGAEGLVFGL